MLRSALVSVFLTLAGAPLLAFSQDYLVTTLTSYHFNREKTYNEFNLGLGLERRYSDTWAGSAGVYRNSFYRSSAYALIGYTPFESAGWRYGVVFGGVTGYENRISPWITGMATRDFGRAGVNVIFAPAAIALQLKYRID